MKINHKQVLLDTLYTRCTFGYHSVLQLFNLSRAQPLQSKYTLIAREETLIVKLNISQLKEFLPRCALLRAIVNYNKNNLPTIDYYTHICYSRHQKQAILIKRMQRAVRRAILLRRQQRSSVSSDKLSMFRDFGFEAKLQFLKKALINNNSKLILSSITEQIEYDTALQLVP